MEITSGKMGSDVVRKHWRDVVDYVVGGEHVVVSRAGKPVVAIIPIEDFRALVGQMEDFRDNRIVDKVIADYLKGPRDDPAMEKLLAWEAEDAAEAQAKQEPMAEVAA